MQFAGLRHRVGPHKDICQFKMPNSWAGKRTQVQFAHALLSAPKYSLLMQFAHALVNAPKCSFAHALVNAPKCSFAHAVCSCAGKRTRVQFAGLRHRVGPHEDICPIHTRADAPATKKQVCEDERHWKATVM